MDDRVANLLLQEATLQNNVNKAIYKTPPVVPATVRSEARVIDTERLIHHWLSTHKDSPFTEQNLKDMDIQTLTRIIMGYPNRESYMSLMLDNSGIQTLAYTIITMHKLSVFLSTVQKDCSFHG